MSDPRDPVEGEIASYCELCHQPCTYHLDRRGWRVVHVCAGPKPRYAEAIALEPPRRTIGEEDL